MTTPICLLRTICGNHSIIYVSKIYCINVNMFKLITFWKGPFYSTFYTLGIFYCRYCTFTYTTLSAHCFIALLLESTDRANSMILAVNNMWNQNFVCLHLCKICRKIISTCQFSVEWQEAKIGHPLVILSCGLVQHQNNKLNLTSVVLPSQLLQPLCCAFIIQAECTFISMHISVSHSSSFCLFSVPACVQTLKLICTVLENCFLCKYFLLDQLAFLITILWFC